MRSGRLLIHLVVLGLYIALSLILTWPLAGHLSTHVPGDGGDDPAIAWNLWWVKHALVDQGSNPFDCRRMFYPLGINLAFYTLTVLNACLSIPLQAIFNLITVSNLLLLSSFVIGAYGAYLLTADLLRTLSRNAGRSASPNGHAISESQVAPGRPQPTPVGLRTLPGLGDVSAAFFAGLVYAFSSSKLFYAALGQFNIASNQWIPYYILMLIKMARRPQRWRYAILAALFLIMQGWAEMTYAAFLLVFTFLYLLASLEWPAIVAWARRGGNAPAPRLKLLGRALLILALLVAVGMAPLLASMLPDMRAEGDFFVEGAGFADVFSSDLAGFLLPTQHHPLLGYLVEHFQFPHDKAQHYYAGYSVLALAGVGFLSARRRKETRFWAVSALFFFLLTLGPTLRVNGHDTSIPMPFQIFQGLPFFKGNRYPSRWGVLLVLSLATLAGLGWYALWRRLGRRPLRALLLGGAVIGAFLFEHVSIPLPMSDLRLPTAYRAIMYTEAGDYAILDLPIAWRNGFRITGVMHPIFMYAQFYQTSHAKRLLGGNTSRNPELKFQYFTETPALNTIIALENGRPLDPAQREADQQVAPALLRFFDIRWVVVHRPTAGVALNSYVRSVLPIELYHQDETYSVYRVRQEALPAEVHPAERLDDPLARLALGEGWAVPAGGKVWAQAPWARLLWRGGPALTLELRAPAPQRLTVWLNRCRLGQVALTPEWQTLTFSAPADCQSPLLDDVWLQAERALPAAPLSPSATRRVAGVLSPVEITVQSAGKEVGDFGHIYINGIERSPGKRGYNLVAVPPGPGLAIQTATFDTHLDETAASRLAGWIDALPEGTIVAVAAMDEASRLLNGEAVAALAALGLAGDLRGHFRASHAAIGVKGTPAGSALEVLSDTAPATVILGEGLTRPQRYFELRSLR